MDRDVFQADATADAAMQLQQQKVSPLPSIEAAVALR